MYLLIYFCMCVFYTSAINISRIKTIKKEQKYTCKEIIKKYIVIKNVSKKKLNNN